MFCLVRRHTMPWDNAAGSPMQGRWNLKGCPSGGSHENKTFGRRMLDGAGNGSKHPDQNTHNGDDKIVGNAVTKPRPNPRSADEPFEWSPCGIGISGISSEACHKLLKS